MGAPLDSATHPCAAMQVDVAVKVLVSNGHDHVDEMTKVEAQICEGLRHPNVIQVRCSLRTALHQSADRSARHPDVPTPLVPTPNYFTCSASAPDVSSLIHSIYWFSSPVLLFSPLSLPLSPLQTFQVRRAVVNQSWIEQFKPDDGPLAGSQPQSTATSAHNSRGADAAHSSRGAEDSKMMECFESNDGASWGRGR